MRILLLLLLAGTVGASETAIYNVTGYTSTNTGTHEFSVLIVSDSGKVVATGGQELLGRHPAANRIDGRGRTLLPGLTDAHAHMFGLGFLAVSLDIAGTPSLDDAVSRIADYARDHPHAAWIQGRGWNQVLWPVREFPTAAHIDAVVSDRPVWLRRIDGHAAWANSKALAIAGIDDDTPDPFGGKIIRDSSGHATGTLVDKAMSLVASKIPPPSREDYRKALLAAFRQLTSLGLTGVHDAGINITEAETYMWMADDQQMNMRIYAMIEGAGENLDAIGKPVHSFGNDRLAIATVKLVADGAFGSRGAAMFEPYADDVENRGLPYWTQEELDRFVRKSSDMGFQVAIHAIGDLGNKMSLDAFDKAQGGKPSPLRNRIEHVQVVRLEDIPRFAELGIIASMQATHATSDMNMAEGRVGPERIKGAYAWRKFLDAGVIIANGSDFPVELANPMHGLYASVTRKSRAGLPDGGWYAGEAMTREEALHSFTWTPAYAAHQEDRLGSLEAGKWADFIVVDRDFFEIPESEIDDIQVFQTWVGGDLVYESCADEMQADCGH